ncbi:MAG: hypothetical protein IKQ81_03585 [Clostridiales bacterium]|nr:hypothetical protein [Clostridiales bacterium]
MAVICRSCAGRLVFNPASQALECVKCGNSYRPEDIEDENAELHSKYYDTRVYICPQCGAEVITSDTEVSTFCVYCGNPAVVFDRVAKQYRPDGIVPFKITREEAAGVIRKRFMNNPIVPKEVKARCVPENLRGIYVPYWVVNAEFREADFLKGEVKRGKSSVTYYYTRAGEVRLRNLPIDGSEILSDDVSFRLEPFYLEDARTFDEDYLNGFYSNTSDITYSDLRAAASEHCQRMYAEEVVKSVKANNVKIVDSLYWADIQDDPVYMMMPVWFFTFRHEEKPYTILVNGQTGRVVGTMPWKTKSVWAFAISLFVLLLGLIAFALWASLARGNDLASVAMYIVIAMLAGGFALTATGFNGIRRVMNNLKLTQSESMFRYVKRRQG